MTAAEVWHAEVSEGLNNMQLTVNVRQELPNGTEQLSRLVTEVGRYLQPRIGEVSSQPNASEVGWPDVRVAGIAVAGPRVDARFVDR